MNLSRLIFNQPRALGLLTVCPMTKQQFFLSALFSSILTIVGAPLRAAGPRAYVANETSGNVSVVDLASNAVVATIPVGSTPIMAVANASDNNVYVANFGSNTVSTINAGSNTVSTTISVGTNPAGEAVDPVGTDVYVTNFGGNTV